MGSKDAPQSYRLPLSGHPLERYPKIMEKLTEAFNEAAQGGESKYTLGQLSQRVGAGEFRQKVALAAKMAELVRRGDVKNTVELESPETGEVIGVYNNILEVPEHFGEVDETLAGKYVTPEDVKPYYHLTPGQAKSPWRRVKDFLLG